MRWRKLKVKQNPVAHFRRLHCEMPLLLRLWETSPSPSHPSSSPPQVLQQMGLLLTFPKQNAALTHFSPSSLIPTSLPPSLPLCFFITSRSISQFLTKQWAKCEISKHTSYIFKACWWVRRKKLHIMTPSCQFRQTLHIEGGEKAF